MATSIKDGQDDLYPIMVLAANMIFVDNLCLLEYVSYLLSSLVVTVKFVFLTFCYLYSNYGNQISRVRGGRS